MADTEHVTVVFTDMVGSTALAAGMSPADADDLRRTHFSLLRQAVAAAGASEVKNLGDGLMVVARLASAALGCAVSMQQAVEAHNRTAPSPVGLRVGVSCGEVTREGDDYFGDAVVEAARLCGAAAAGQVLVSALARASAGRRSAHALVAVGALDLKGLPEPLETYELAWEPIAVDGREEGVPLPPRLAHRPAFGLVGRDIEVGVLESAAKRVAAGEGREVVLVAGEPGQGKTTLIAEAARSAHMDGMVVLLGRCDESVGAPYAPFADALSHLAAHVDGDLLRRHVQAHGAELARLVPMLGLRVGPLPPPASADADTERYLLFAAVVGLLDAASADRAVMLVLDDLHWADKPTLQLLRHVVTHTGSTRLLVAGAYRDAELSAAHPLTETLGDLRREPAVRVLPLGGLDDVAVVSFMESAAGHTLDEEGMALAHAVYRETDGNPFFVSEVLRDLAETGAIVRAPSGRWSARGPGAAIALPDSVRQVVGARVARLGEVATRVLSAAAVIGREFELDLTAGVTGVDEDALMELLEEAHAAALVRELDGAPGRYTFSHALVQHTIYEDLGPTRRVRLHRQVAEALEAALGDTPGARVGELARHYLLATQPAEADKALSYARQAGEGALAALAPDEALRWFAQALSLASAAGPALRTDVLIGLGTAQRQVGDPEFRSTLLEAARIAEASGDTQRLVAAALANYRGMLSANGAVDGERVEVLRAALHSLGDADTPERAHILSRMCSELSYAPLDDRLALAHEAKAVARRLPDPRTLAEVITDCSIPLRFPSTLVEQFDDIREAIHIAEGTADPVAQFWTATWGYVDATSAGDFALAERCLDVERATNARLQQPLMLWITACHEAALALQRGEPGRAEELAARAFEIGTACAQPDAFMFYGGQLMVTRHYQGRLGELVDLIADLAEQNPGMSVFPPLLAWARLEADDATTARGLLDAAAASAFELPMNTVWLDGVIAYSSVAIELQAREAAQQLLALLTPYHDHVPCEGVVTREPVAVFLGGLATVVGRYDDAERYFDEADELNARGGMSFAQAENDLWRARLLLLRQREGDAERARDLLERARSAASTHGYALIEQRATNLLSR
jgi:class 3 adenylate cyclase/tetratricopeptide (TPR) repeat protein